MEYVPNNTIKPYSVAIEIVVFFIQTREGIKAFTERGSIIIVIMIKCIIYA